MKFSLPNLVAVLGALRVIVRQESTATILLSAAKQQLTLLRSGFEGRRCWWNYWRMGFVNFMSQSVGRSGSAP